MAPNPSYKLLSNSNDLTKAVIAANSNGTMGVLDKCVVRFRSTTSLAPWTVASDNKIKKGPVATAGATSYPPETLFVLQSVQYAAFNAYILVPQTQQETNVWMAGKGKDADLVAAISTKGWADAHRVFYFANLWAWNESSGDATLAVKMYCMFNGSEKRWVRMNEKEPQQVYGNTSTVSEFFIDISQVGPTLASLMPKGYTWPPTLTPSIPVGTPGGSPGSSPGSTDNTPGLTTPSSNPPAPSNGGVPMWVWIVAGVSGFLILVLVLVIASR